MSHYSTDQLLAMDEAKKEIDKLDSKIVKEPILAKAKQVFGKDVDMKKVDAMVDKAIAQARENKGDLKMAIAIGLSYFKEQSVNEAHSNLIIKIKKYSDFDKIDDVLAGVSKIIPDVIAVKKGYEGIEKMMNPDEDSLTAELATSIEAKKAIALVKQLLKELGVGLIKIDTVENWDEQSFEEKKKPKKKKPKKKETNEQLSLVDTVIEEFTPEDGEGSQWEGQYPADEYDVAEETPDEIADALEEEMDISIQEVEVSEEDGILYVLITYDYISESKKKEKRSKKEVKKQ